MEAPTVCSTRVVSVNKIYLKVMVLFALCVSGMLYAQIPANTGHVTVPVPMSAHDGCTVQVPVTKTVGPATLDLLERALDFAKRRGCSSVLLNINTPGGSLQATRTIVEKILASPVPILCLISPAGGHAGSAGALIMQACHVTGALEATNMGAATPISSSGSLPEDLRKKLIQDTVSWVRSLAEFRGRNAKFAEEMVVDAKSLGAEQARQAGGLDFVSSSVDAFLKSASEKSVRMGPSDVQTAAGLPSIEKVKVGALLPFDPDLRTEFLHVVADPEFAYILFMVSLGLLYFEFTHTGVFLPGVAGALGLVTSLLAFQKLEVWWSGLIFIFLGVAFLVGEAFVPSFGALGIGGVLSLLAGSVLLFNPSQTGYVLPLPILISAASLLALVILALAILLIRTRKRQVTTGAEGLIGQMGEVISVSENPRQAVVMLKGELWQCECDEDLSAKNMIEVLELVDLKLRVKIKK